MLHKTYFLQIGPAGKALSLLLVRAAKERGTQAVAGVGYGHRKDVDRGAPLPSAPARPDESALLLQKNSVLRLCGGIPRHLQNRKGSDLGAGSTQKRGTHYGRRRRCHT